MTVDFFHIVKGEGGAMLQIPEPMSFYFSGSIAPTFYPGDHAHYIDLATGNLYEYANGAWAMMMGGTAVLAGSVPLFIQDAAPSTAASKYLWMQTNAVGAQSKFWVEDGA